MLTIIKQALAKIPASPTPHPDRSARGAAARARGYAVEDAAAKWLQTQGLKLVARNVRYTFGELDIVAWHGDVLVLFEVKYRSSSAFGGAAASITPRKQARLWAAGEAYAAQFAKPPPMRIDVLTFTASADEPEWIKNALG